MYTDEDKQQVVELSRDGWKVADIMSETGMSRATVYRILNDYENEDDEGSDTCDTEEEDWSEASASNHTQFQGNYHPSDTYENNHCFSDTPSQNISQGFSNSSQDNFDTDEKPDETPQSTLRFSSRASENPEVEMLRLRLEHDREMEKLRQQANAQELEELRLRNKAQELALEKERLRKENQLEQGELLKQAESRRKADKKLLVEIKHEIEKLDAESEDSVFTTDELESYYDSFIKLRRQIEERAIEHEEKYDTWLIWNVVVDVIAVLEDATYRINNNFFSTNAELQWPTEDREVIETALNCYALNQLYEYEDD